MRAHRVAAPLHARIVRDVDRGTRCRRRRVLRLRHPPATQV